MGFTLDLKDLVSREIREQIAPNGREISGLLDIFDTDEGLGLGGKIVQIGKNVLGFVLGKLPKLILSFVGAFGWLVGKASQISNFNWLATDAQLKASLKSRNLAVADAWGSFVGVLGGTVAIGVLGAGIAYYLPVIGGKALAMSTVLELIKERGDELWDEFKNALRVTFDAVAQSVAINSFIAARKYLRKNISALNNWGKEEGARWTISEAIEEKIDAIPNEWLRTFTEAALEEGWESFIEGGYVVARFWDEQMLQARANRLEILGEDRSLSLELDKDNRGEVVRFTSIPSNLAIATAQGTINQYRLMRNRNIGNFEDPDDSQKVLQPYLRTAKIILRGETDKPPFIKTTGDQSSLGEPASRHQISLKALKPDLRWRDFKKVFRSLRWGSWKIEATLKSRVTIFFYAEDREAGKFKMREILDELIEEDAIRIVTSLEEVDPRIAKVPKTVYPEKAIVTIKRESVGGRVNDLAGTRYEQRRIEFRLWQDEKPYGTPEYVTRYPIED